VNADNVIPFRKRPPSTAELDAYRQMTRHWSEEMKQLMFPEHFRLEHQQNHGSRVTGL
jgi:hypothetical protein